MKACSIGHRVDAILGLPVWHMILRLNNNLTGAGNSLFGHNKWQNDRENRFTEKEVRAWIADYSVQSVPIFL